MPKMPTRPAAKPAQAPPAAHSAPAAPEPTKPSKANPPARTGRPLIYPAKEGDDTPWTLEEWRALTTEERVQVVPRLGDEALTAEQARKLFGWQEMAQRDDSTCFQDAAGKWIRGLNNTHNRWFDDARFRRYVQDILNRNWAGTGDDPDETINGETIIIGRSGEILSGQKRLAALVIAAQIWAGIGDLEGGKADQSRHWKTIWPTEPTLPCLIIFGVSETQRVVRTIDDVQPRSAADVFFLDHDLLGKFPPKDRQRLARMLDYATALLWERTGAKEDPHSPYRTNSEVVDFVNRHKRLLACVKHIWEEDSSGEGGAVSRYVSLGYASALMYLMAASASDGNAYRAAATPSEKQLDFSLWDKASLFWSDLAGSAPAIKPVWLAEMPLENDKTAWGGYIFKKTNVEEHKSSFAERAATLAKAWTCYKAGRKITNDDLLTAEDYCIDRFPANAPGVDSSLWGAIESATLRKPHPTFGGIDLEGKDDGEDIAAADPNTPSEETKEEIERRKAALHEEQKAKLLEDRAKNGGGSKAGAKPTITDVAEQLEKNGKVPAQPKPPPRPVKPVNKTATTSAGPTDHGKKPTGNRGPR